MRIVRYWVSYHIVIFLENVVCKNIEEMAREVSVRLYKLSYKESTLAYCIASSHCIHSEIALFEPYRLTIAWYYVGSYRTTVVNCFVNMIGLQMDNCLLEVSETCCRICSTESIIDICGWCKLTWNWDWWWLIVICICWLYTELYGSWI